MKKLSLLLVALALFCFISLNSCKQQPGQAETEEATEEVVGEAEGTEEAVADTVAEEAAAEETME